MQAGLQAILAKIAEDTERGGNERYIQFKNEIDEAIESENEIFQADLGKRREILLKHNERELIGQKERLSRRLNREILTYQQELLDGIFDMAVEKLRKISARDFAKMFQKAVKGLSGSFTLRLGELSAGKLDEADINEAVKSSPGLSIKLVPETIPGKSGFTLRDERVEYNSLFEDLIEDKKTEQYAVILKEVFSGCEKLWGH